MLVHIVEPREQGQLRLRRAFSVLKGLDRLDCCPIISAYTADHPKVGLIPLPAFVDGELRSSGGAPSSQKHELPKEIVQRGPQLVTELPDDEPETGFGKLAANPKDVLAGIALEVTHDGATFVVKPFEEPLPFLVERGQVLLRAFDSPIDGF
jgi:hypothetical protein